MYRGSKRAAVCGYRRVQTLQAQSYARTVALILLLSGCSANQTNLEVVGVGCESLTVLKQRDSQEVKPPGG